jgi:hypothetical protein
MSSGSDILDLASEIAEIARMTTDPDTGRCLMRLVHRMLTEAGLEPGSDQGDASAGQHADYRLRATVSH